MCTASRRVPLDPNDELIELLARTALADRAAFDRLYMRTSAKLFGVTLRILKDRAEAEDALQEVYVKIWQKADRFVGERARAMSWLIAIARNHAIEKLRARKAPVLPMEMAEDIRDSAPTPEAAAVNTSARAQLDACLDQLETQKAQAVRAAYIEGYSYKELADHFETPLNTMRTWLRRSLQKLKDCLQA